MNNTTALRCRSVRADQPHKIRYSEDLNAVVVAEPKQIAVTGHDKLRACRDGAFEDTVVVRIRRYRVDRLARMDAASEIANARRSLVKRFLRPSELVTQDPVHLIQQHVRDAEAEHATARGIEELKWSAGE